MNTDQNIDASQFLQSLAPGELPLDIFMQVARLSVVPVVEIVPFAKQEETLSVLLFQRPSNDQLWAKKWYIPGAIVLPSDTEGGIEDPISRVITTKLGFTKTSKPIFVTNRICHTARGTELAIIYYVEVIDVNEQHLASFYSVSELPNNLIEGHREFITAALGRYKESGRN